MSSMVLNVKLCPQFTIENVVFAYLVLTVRLTALFVSRVRARKTVQLG